MILESMQQTLRQKARLKAYQPKEVDETWAEVDTFSLYVTRFCFVAIVVFVLVTGFIKVAIPYLRHLLGM